MGKWTNIFKTGTHTDSSGKTRTWTRRDLATIVANYQQRTEDAALVFGHPKSADPAEGWISAVRLNGEILQAQFTQVSDKTQKGLDNKRYKYGSLSLSRDLKIRHFGLLGAVPPAVKGLGRVEFSEAMTVDINFSEPEDTPGEEDEMPEDTKAKEKVADLEKRLADEKAAREKAEGDLKAKDDEFTEAATKQRKKDLEDGVDKLVEGGKLKPADKDKVLAFCEALDGGEEMSFSESEGKKPLTTHFMEFMGQRDGHGLLNEFSEPSESGAEKIEIGDLAGKF